MKTIQPDSTSKTIDKILIGLMLAYSLVWTFFYTGSSAIRHIWEFLITLISLALLTFGAYRIGRGKLKETLRKNIVRFAIGVFLGTIVPLVITIIAFTYVINLSGLGRPI